MPVPGHQSFQANHPTILPLMHSVSGSKSGRRDPPTQRVDPFSIVAFHCRGPTTDENCSCGYVDGTAVSRRVSLFLAPCSSLKRRPPNADLLHVQARVGCRYTWLIFVCRMRHYASNQQVTRVADEKHRQKSHCCDVVRGRLVISWPDTARMSCLDALANGKHPFNFSADN